MKHDDAMDLTKPQTRREGVRPAIDADIDPLAHVWYDGWHDAHVQIVPAQLTQVRTLGSFRQRVQALLPEIRVIGPPGEPYAFSIIKDDEIYQLYVSSAYRGSGTAATLITDAETHMAERGIQTAWLACAIGNHRAARFYEKRGWQRVGVITYDCETSAGMFPLDVWRYEKALA